LNAAAAAASASADAAAPREKIELVSPAERARRANERIRENTKRGGDGNGGGDGGGWTILDGGVGAERSVLEKDEWSKFDEIDWGD
jgi:hypothetical protein